MVKRKEYHKPYLVFYYEKIMKDSARKAMFAKSQKKIKNGLYYLKDESDAQEMMSMYYDDHKISRYSNGEPKDGSVDSFSEKHNGKDYQILYWRKNGDMKIQVGFPLTRRYSYS